MTRELIYDTVSEWMGSRLNFPEDEMFSGMRHIMYGVHFSDDDAEDYASRPDMVPEDYTLVHVQEDFLLEDGMPPPCDSDINTCCWFTEDGRAWGQRPNSCWKETDLEFMGTFNGIGELKALLDSFLGAYILKTLLTTAIESWGYIDGYTVEEIGYHAWGPDTWEEQIRAKLKSHEWDLRLVSSSNQPVSALLGISEAAEVAEFHELDSAGADENVEPEMKCLLQIYSRKDLINWLEVRFGSISN
jgi:hypothetical protein